MNFNKALAISICLLTGGLYAGLHPEAVKTAEKSGIGLVRMDKVPGECKVGAYEASITVRNLTEEPLRGSFALLVAETDEENPTFRRLASDRIDLTLASVSSAEKELTVKGGIPQDLLWRDVKVVIEARGKEIVLFDGFIPGEGERPARKVREIKEQPIRAGEVLSCDKIVKADDYFIKSFSAAFLTQDGKKDGHVAAATAAGWKVRGIFADNRNGWKELAKNIDRFDAVVSMTGFTTEAPIDVISNFVARGGLLWVNGGRNDNAFSGLSWLYPKSPFPHVVVRTVGEKETDNHIVTGETTHGVGPGWIQRYPAFGNYVDYVPVARFESTRDTRFWGQVAIAQNTPRGVCGDIVLRGLIGSGMVIAATTPTSDAQFYENLRYHTGLQRHGLGYANPSWHMRYAPHEARTGHREMSFGACFINTGREPRDFLIKVVLDYGDGRTKTLWKTLENVTHGNGGAGFKYKGREIYGRTHGVMTIVDKKTGYTITRDLGTVDRPDIVSIKTQPQHAWVSEKRIKPEVEIGVMCHAAGGLGSAATLETYNPDGSLLSRQEGVIRQGYSEADKGAWFEVPTSTNSPCGDYRLVATVDLLGEKFVRESHFTIKAVEPGQTIFDQDGTLISEGRRYYGYGAYHLGHFDNPIGPWLWDSEKKEMIIPKEALKEDGTPFTLWDIGFTFTQCWQGEWEANCSSDIEVLKKKNPIDAVWSLLGRQAINFDLLINDKWKECMEECQAIIDKDPEFYNKWAAKNAERARRAKAMGTYYCLEQGMPAYYQTLYPGRFRKPGDDKLRYQRDNYKEVKDIARSVLKQDICHTVGGWYVADECGGDFYFATQRDALFEVDQLHPTTLLGDTSALHYCTEFGLDQLHPDIQNIPMQRPIDSVFSVGRVWRLRDAPHGGGLICCHRSAGNHRGQNFDTLFTVELSAIIAGLNGSMCYTWREDQRLKGSYGSGWDFERPRQMKKVVERVKEIEPYFLKYRGTCAKSNDGKCRARVCGDDETGKIVICVNFERMGDSNARLTIPELADRKLVPFYEEDAKPIAVNHAGSFVVAFKPDVSRVFKVVD